MASCGSSTPWSSTWWSGALRGPTRAGWPGARSGRAWWRSPAPWRGGPRRRQRPTRNDGPNDDRPDDIGRRRGDVADLALLFGAYVVLTPTLHPWYLVALLALLPLMTPTPAPGPRSADRWAGWLPVTPWLWLAATAPLSYLTYLDPAAPAERSWVRQVEWWPTLALLVLAALWIGADDDRADRSRVSTGH